MAFLDEFESILKEVVHAKRLSASKMTKLTEIALKSMQHDTQIVSILYRSHKSLPPAAKVSSLYVFDALSRAARSQVNKQGITGDINSPKGNSATFLLKVEGVLEGLFQDMVTTGSPEAKVSKSPLLTDYLLHVAAVALYELRERPNNCCHHLLALLIWLVSSRDLTCLVPVIW
ncbi:hypothetical protein H0H81_001654 [Sphagnurus paluster]|uniref:CID domain-containing protein n=1 Tax=Sphagnurus paluster TaxID=117069 RepID=A0A9P7FVQ6_9AGAR|nr:hypothetical protein H0H81_001654 [Sphagnurus paluster]